VLKKFIKVSFSEKVLGEDVSAKVSSLKDGEVLLLQNVRTEKGEQAKDLNFAKSLAKLADLYVNDAFAVSHREDSSIVLLPKLLSSYAGLQLENEIKELSSVFKKPKHPFLFILGGAKFSTKMPLIKKYIKIADYIFVGGALANDFLKSKGYEVGRSLVDNEDYGIEKLLKNKKILLPKDVLIRDLNGNLFIKKVGEISKEDTIIDVGVETEKDVISLVSKSKMILWNGPLGKYEDSGDKATRKILKAITLSKARSIIGGGDTAVLVSEMKIEKKISFVSTGGGATLDFLAKGTLPGIKALVR
jgi:phosphoglycerate kinase